MYKICLISNYDSMSRHEFADLRPWLSQKGYSYKMYNSLNIKQIKYEFLREDFDCLISTTSALNDREIQTVVLDDEFKYELEIFLSAGKGLIILHQYEYARNRGSYDILPESAGELLPILIPADETHLTGKYLFASHNKKHPVLLFPNIIDENDLLDKAVNSRYFKGAYWYYNEYKDSSYWEGIIIDRPGAKQRNILVQSNVYNIFICSALIDFQKQENLIENLIVNAVTRGNSYAFLTGKNRVKDYNDEFIEETLLANKQYVKRYEIVSGESEDYKEISDNMNQLIENLDNKLHGTILLSNHIDFNKIILQNEILLNAIEKNNIKVINISDEHTRKGLKLYGASNKVYMQYETLKKQVIEGFSDGFYGSFWNTIYIISELIKIEPDFARGESRHALYPVLDKFISSSTNGSYDNTLSTTCVFYWIQKLLNYDRKQSIKPTVTWIERNFLDTIDKQDYLFLKPFLLNKDIEHGIFGKDLTTAKRYMENMLSAYTTPIQANILLSFSLLYQEEKITLEIVNRITRTDFLNEIQDVRILAQLLYSLIRVTKEQCVRLDQDTANALHKKIFHSVNWFRKYVDDGFTTQIETMQAPAYLAAIAAIIEFDKTIEYPVDDLLNIIGFYKNKIISKTKKITRSDRLEEEKVVITNQKKEIARLQKEISTLTNAIEVVKKTEKRNHIYLTVILTLAGMLGLIIICLFVYTYNHIPITIDNNNESMFTLLFKSIFNEVVGIISALSAVIGGSAGFLKKFIIKR